LKYITLNPMLPQLAEHQRFYLLSALTLTAQTRATHFDSYHLLDALIDLEDHSLIQHDEWLYNLAENKLANLSNDEILTLIIELTQTLQKQEVKAA